MQAHVCEKMRTHRKGKKATTLAHTHRRHERNQKNREVERQTHMKRKREKKKVKKTTDTHTHTHIRKNLGDNFSFAGPHFSATDRTEIKPDDLLVLVVTYKLALNSCCWARQRRKTSESGVLMIMKGKTVDACFA